MTELSLGSILPLSQGATEKTTQHHDGHGGGSSATSIPDQIGRYEIHSLLGEGGYGRVFKGHDTQLRRFVAIKVPHVYRMTTDQSLDTYLEEARTVATLDHPAVVAVHDVGVTEEGLPYIVSSFIDGMSLGDRMRRSPLNLADGIQLLCTVGRALSYVHSRGIIHRDIKPGNILLSEDGRPFVADFGLALREELDEANRLRVGTPAYMSPEQARGEAHLVDGRSDIYSLGVVLYEMLTGKLPFGGETRKAVMRNLLEKEVPPPRQINPSIPRELERICLKALAKRSSDRYNTAADLVDDLEFFLSELDSAGESVSGNSESTVHPSSSRSSKSVVPRGLRSFERHDSSFFRRLLPGPYDRDWVPESLLFWKRKLEPTDVDDPLRVGVIYGPSGCGKSSFVKAGLIPIIDSSTSVVFVEATHVDTEARLLRGLRKRCPTLPPKLNLVESLAEIRRGRTLSKGGRLVIVIDQFEQWLHGRDDQDNSELAMTLRQCDGARVQCVLLLRDDFWLAMSRFASTIEVPLKQNHNVTMVDLFSLPHARRVLADFGVAYDRLSDSESTRTPQENLFLDTAIKELSEDAKVIPVRLALFVEMIKNQPWEIATLMRLGGVHGIGTQFLEESFSTSHAPASRRVHEIAVRNVLQQLLPEQGGTLKGNMKSEKELLVASGYEDQPSAFDSLVEVLDNELRLITPTDPIGSTMSDDSLSESGDGMRYYQLTHDFLVPAVDEWIHKKRRETRRGRAELRLAEYATLWGTKPIPKFAPSWFEWLNIRLLTSSKRWSDTESKMMAAAGRRHATVTAAVMTCIVLAAVGLAAIGQRSRIASAVRELRTAEISRLPPILDLLRKDQWFAPGLVREALQSSQTDSRDHLIYRVALLAHDPSQVSPLSEDLLDQPLPIVKLLAAELGPWKDQLSPKLWQTLNDDSRSDAERFRAAFVLASFDPPQGDTLEGQSTVSRQASWLAHRDEIVDWILQQGRVAPQDYNIVLEQFQPAKSTLVETLASRSVTASEVHQRSTALGILIHYVRDNPSQLLHFALGASEEQVDVFRAELNDLLPQLRDQIADAAAVRLDSMVPEVEYDRLAARKATAVALLHALGEPEPTWGLLQQSAMPHDRTYLIHRAPRMGARFEVLLKELVWQTDPFVRQGIILMLGHFDIDRVDPRSATESLRELKHIFENDPNVNVHSAARWCLRRHGQAEWIRQSIQKQSGLPRDPRKDWYVNLEGQTMAVFDARNEPTIGRVFEIATTEVTKEQFQRFVPGFEYYAPHRFPEPDCPTGSIHWYFAADYCRWLSQKLNADPDHSYPEFEQLNGPLQDFDAVLEHGAYRLPTAAEWQYVCTANTNSLRYFGKNDSLVDEYFWHYETSLIDPTDMKIRYYPADLKKPNDFGLFGLYDGVREWCHDLEDNGARRTVMGYRSGLASLARTNADVHSSDLPRSSNGFYGLRVARTVK